MTPAYDMRGQACRVGGIFLVLGRDEIAAAGGGLAMTDGCVYAWFRGDVRASVLCVGC